MTRQPILNLLASYTASNESELAGVHRTTEFIQSHPDCFERTLLTGHVTGSAWIVNEGFTHVLLIHHFKLNRWLQPGGHCDGDGDVLNVALKEAGEETGLTVKPVSDRIFDVDIHQIPQRGDVPAHLHYDIRFLFTADMGQSLILNQQETRDIKWVLIREVSILNDSEGVMRMVLKTLMLALGLALL
ncbi:MAG TPA: NUDIX hydrolase [Mucilaginibacter sp.]|nr:NUDIX hydrolase [Mucilaginibacter sp.]